ncbi:ABC transporter ATP-binding protein [Devosia sp.]|uniref:ABC transporter ATP-binding protein n=1 Tax=Devosia sp. TaxID=1871048 RepID=UPI002AFE0025|nr:ATP-binding cassette domain-containing protein [Devosia sp.]
MSLLRVEALNFAYVRGSGRVPAVRAVDLALAQGEVLGIVGESGSGKSSLARCLVGLSRPDSGSIMLDGAVLGRRRTREQHRIMQMVFQDPRSSLNPRMNVFRQIEEGWRTHVLVRPADPREAAAALLERVGLSAEYLDRRPAQLSGGQAQRVSIARALAVSPRLLICDEAVSALDVSVQTQVLALLAEIRRELNLAIIFISHDLGVVRQISDRVAVMYLGQVVETGPVEEIFERPRHAYTRTLLGSALDMAADLPGGAG